MFVNFVSKTCKVSFRSRSFFSIKNVELSMPYLELRSLVNSLPMVGILLKKRKKSDEDVSELLGVVRDLCKQNKKLKNKLKKQNQSLEEARRLATSLQTELVEARKEASTFVNQVQGSMKELGKVKEQLADTQN